MTVLVALETVLLAVLTVLVAGLLRAYGSVLRRLHALDGGAHGPTPFSIPDADAAAPLASPLDDPQRREEWTAAHDVAGETLTGEVVTSRVGGVEHDTVLLFLSSGCSSCAVFWDELARPENLRLPAATRLLIVTQDADADSRSALAELAPPGLDVIMSSAAWRDYEVPGSPYVVLAAGRTGRVRGEGTGQSWRQIAELLAQASGDAAYLTGGPSPAKPRSDAEREADADRQLLMAGILPGDPRLYELPGDER
ncbi:MAG: hypothetical protein ACTHMS_13735 [Jatrophihabitans sp.]|uniref:hypothetical protein n=1 Tax=Jatrophihabitans sp. TaxID=1932789 RepID=UPI003F7D717D